MSRDEPPLKRLKKDPQPELIETTKPIKDIYLKEFTNLNERISTLLSSARRDCLNSIEDFVSDKVRKMGSIMTFYHNIFCNLDVQNRKELDNKISQLYGDKEIRESVDELIELESEWDEFLEGVDKKLNGDKIKNELAVGDQGPCELMLTDVRTESQLSLGEILKKCAQSDLLLILLRHFA